MSDRDGAEGAQAGPVESTEAIERAEGVAPQEVEPEATAPREATNQEAPAEFEPDPVLLAAREQARDALAEITEVQSIGADEGYEAYEAHVLTLFFECRLAGYPGWRWAATLARVDEESQVNVLEVELLPGPGAVVAPEWVPWSVRLAQYREAQARQAAEEAADAEAAAAELEDEDDVDPEDDLMTNDFSDYDDELDGVELDDESESGEDASDAEDEDADSDDDEDADIDESDELDLDEGDDDSDDTDDESDDDSDDEE